MVQQDSRGHKIGCATITLRKIEAEERRPSLPIIEQLTKIFEIPENEQKNFLKFSRGDWKKAPGETAEETPWTRSQAGSKAKNNLPMQLTSFIGREQEINEIIGSILEHRLVTLTGVGGVGKTRLALKTAADLLDQFRDGVWFVELAPLNDPSLVEQIIVSTLIIPERQGLSTLKRLKDFLRSKKLLLVMDNCEHLITACAEIVDTVLSNSPGVKILATSREPLGISGEMIWQVSPLSPPDIDQPPTLEQLSQYEAVQLFIDRAMLVQPDFLLTQNNASAVTQICYRLDGIPLAIELAAARARILSVEQIASRLDDRFRLLTEGSRTALPRQQTLQAAIDWSYELLPEEECVLFRQLSVFAGGWTLEAAEQVCAGDQLASDQILDILLHLADKSLVMARTQETHPRYYMLETVRQYAHERLEESGKYSSARDRHLEYFITLAEQASPHFFDAEQFLWLDRFEIELDNVRAALTWALQSNSVEAGLRLASGLTGESGGFWMRWGHEKEGYEFLEQLLTNSQTISQVHILAEALLASASLLFWLYKPSAAIDRAEQSESLWRQLGPAYKVKAAAARLIKTLSYTLVNTEYEHLRILQEYEAVLQIFREVNDRRGMAITLHVIANVLRSSGDVVGSRQAFEESRALSRDCGDRIAMSNASASLANIALQEGNYAEARILCEEALSVIGQLPYSLKDVPLWLLGVIERIEGNYAQAKIWYTECLRFDREIGSDMQLPECLIGFAGIAVSEERLERAAQLVGRAQAAVNARQTPYPLEIFDQTELERLTAVLHEELGNKDFETYIVQGSAMTIDQAMTFALEEIDE